MNKRAEIPEDDDIETIEDALETDETDDPEDQQDDAEASEETAEDEASDEESDDSEDTAEDEPAEFSVTLGDEEDDPDETPVIRTLRKKEREARKRVKELEAQVAKAVERPIELEARPTLADHDYDEEKFLAALDTWKDKEREHKQRQAEAKAEADRQEQEWQETHSRYETAKAGLGVKNFSEVEDVVKDILSVQQQGMVLDATVRPEVMVYALGKNPDKAQELAKIKNPVKFIAEIVRLEGNMKVTKNSKPAPEKRVSRGAGVPVSSGKKLEKLEAEADRTGDRTKVIAYKKQLASQK